MKTLSFLVLVTTCFFPIQGITQNPNLPNQHDYIWLIGYDSHENHPLLGGMQKDFNDFHSTFESNYLNIEFEITNGVVADENGNLAFAFNGEYIANANDVTVENGENINPDESVTQMLSYQSALILPSSEGNEQYYLIHNEREWIGTAEDNFDGFWMATLKLYYTLIDMNENNGEGLVIEKNIEILNDTMDFGKLTVTRHANGRDWWLLIPEYWSNKYYRFLVTPEGIVQYPEQIVDLVRLPAVGQAVFTPDGSKYVITGSKRYNENAIHLDIFDFDRCTGLLSNQRRIQFEDLSTGKPTAISPNSRYLYAYFNGYYLQYDLWAEDIEASEVVLAIYDGYENPINIPSPAYLAQLGPDGKIYWSSTSTNLVMHITHDPDMEGEAARFEQHGITLPHLNYGTMANHPNYRLGPLDGSSCDTLGIDNMPVANFRYEIFTDTVPFRDLSIYEPTDWYWTYGDGNSSTDKHNQHIYETGGDYEVCLTVSNINGSDTWCDTVHIFTTDAVGKEPMYLESTLFPNPTSGETYLQTVQNIPQNSSFSLFNSAGQQVFKKSLSSGFSVHQLDFLDLPKGMYFYKILLGDVAISAGKLVLIE